MTSTRNKNTPGNYQMEQRSNINILDYSALDRYGHPSESMFPGDGLLTGRMAPTNLSNNSCDIESELRGIGSTNLVTPRLPPRIELKYLRSLAFTDRVPMILPEDLQLDTNPRPSRT
jgi:hypothetical protein